jgi:hypothetical protein
MVLLAKFSVFTFGRLGSVQLSISHSYLRLITVIRMCPLLSLEHSRQRSHKLKGEKALQPRYLEYSYSGAGIPTFVI